MNILIEDMEMPKNCDDCFLDDFYCKTCQHNRSKEGRQMTTVKYGYWTVEVDEEITTPWLKNRYVCSQCGNWQTYGKTPFCPNCGAKMTMTNGDRIRAMTNEELAEYLFERGNGPEYCYGICAYQDECEEIHAREFCIQKIIDWLQKEIKDG